ncbi:MAG TPA: DUF4350 domain-containing protein [Longimicrobium sp.]|nr:DUF4350 domain-containing protein [Longimicrobium sp.]
MHRIARISIPILISACIATPAAAQQGPDTTWVPSIARPAYAGQSGPRVGIDQAHRNFHTATGNYRPFAELLRRDGYRVSASTQPFTRASLSAFDVLVIANAAGGNNAETVSAPAFTADERTALREWVRRGGSLLLIADHAPYGAATEALSMEFGVGMSKGWTRDTTAGRSVGGNPSFLRFTRANGLLGRHQIMEGRGAGERISAVQSFTGQSLGIPAGAAVLLQLSPTAEDRLPPTPAELRELAAQQQRLIDSLAAAARAGGARDTTVRAVQVRPVAERYTSAAGRAQGVALRFGAGRVVVLGEAAMLSAQRIVLPGRDPIRMGMNVPGSDDQQFALNVMHWLSRLF